MGCVARPSMEGRSGQTADASNAAGHAASWRGGLRDRESKSGFAAERQYQCGYPGGGGESGAGVAEGGFPAARIGHRGFSVEGRSGGVAQGGAGSIELHQVTSGFGTGRRGRCSVADREGDPEWKQGGAGGSIVRRQLGYSQINLPGGLMHLALNEPSSFLPSTNRTSKLPDIIVPRHQW